MRHEIEHHSKPYLFRYRPNNSNTLDEIKNNYIYFSKRSQLNDPFDASLSFVDLKNDNVSIDSYFNAILENIKIFSEHDRFKHNFFHRRKEFYLFFKEGISQFIDKYGIACFTITPLHMMLWASYANKHQGICIQYKTDDDTDFFKGARSVTYVDKIIKTPFDIINSTNVFEKVFFTKASLWREEYEVRLLKERVGKYEINPIAIRSIVFGMNTPFSYKKELLLLVNTLHPHIKVYDSIPLENNFGLSFILLN